MKDLTAREVAELKSRATPYRVSRNLYVRAEAKVDGRGVNRSWLFRYMLNRRQRWMGLGSLEIVTLAEARDKARAGRETPARADRPDRASRR